MFAVRIGSLVGAEEHDEGSTVTAIACVVPSPAFRNVNRDPFGEGRKHAPRTGVPPWIIHTS
jgi:hypothetical protein